jgi:adenylate kinase family enzyme
MRAAAAAAAAAELLCNNNNLSLIGPPGSGKGSYGKHVAHWLGVPLVIASDVLRQLRPECIAQTAKSGQLVDDAIVSEALLEYLSSLSSSSLSSSSSSSSSHYHPRSKEDTSDSATSTTITGGGGRTTTTPTIPHAPLRPGGDGRGGDGGTGNIGYILDGFPRTIAQVQHMQDTWPVALQVQGAICLTVPDSVCETKLLGRRQCPTCHGSFNINGVSFGEWDMPPSLPDFANHCPKYHTTTSTSTTSSTFPAAAQDNGKVIVCHPDTDWHVRHDDTPSIIQERLKLHHGHMDPIVQHFQRQNRLFSFSPYKGFDDVPRLQQSLERWLVERKGQGKGNKNGTSTTT